MGAGQSTNGQSSPQIAQLQLDFDDAKKEINTLYTTDSYKATKSDLDEAVKPLAKTTDIANLAQKSDITALSSSFTTNNLVQKSDLDQAVLKLAKTTDIANLAQKADMASVAQKSDLASVAQKSDLANVAQKSDLASLGQCNSTGNSGSSNPKNIQDDVMLSLNRVVAAHYGITPNPGNITFDNCPFGWKKVTGGGFSRPDATGVSSNSIGLKGIACIISPTTSYNVFTGGAGPNTNTAIKNIQKFTESVPNNLQMNTVANNLQMNAATTNNMQMSTAANNLQMNTTSVRFDGLPIVTYENDDNIYFNPRKNQNFVSSYTCPPNSDLYSYNNKPVCILNQWDYANQMCPNGANWNTSGIMKCL